ncbi:hypothetical protein GDO78_021758 [Eleutherodactylus coqui]|uniref:Uncharacterized protein n=1 Tax=Eleutherodactylus coqui TaxID=57060 RepID=A0A8J6BIM8_ELECQ|nr:hypothetical protein GDO78_021758 [Eleutherodactylus coqui]
MWARGPLLQQSASSPSYREQIWIESDKQIKVGNDRQNDCRVINRWGVEGRGTRRRKYMLQTLGTCCTSEAEHVLYLRSVQPW